MFNPMMAYNFLQSVRLLADAAISLHRQPAWSASKPRIDNITKRRRELADAGHGAERSASATTSAPRSPKTAHKNGTTLREEAVGGGYLTDAEFTKLVRPGEDDRGRSSPAKQPLHRSRAISFAPEHAHKLASRIGADRRETQGGQLCGSLQ